LAGKHDELDVDLRRRKRFFIPWFRSQYKDAMEAFDVSISQM
jgi:hypothetical protein